MIRPEQIKGLSEWLDKIIVDGYADKDKIVFVRKNGETIEYKKETGKKGAAGRQLEPERGDRGLDPYELSGFSGTEAEWKNSLKGVSGVSGRPGKDSREAVNGNTPTVVENILVKKSQNPSVRLLERADGQYQLIMSLPSGKKNVPGKNGVSYTLSPVAKISVGDPSAKIVWTGTVGRIEISLPRGIRGRVGATNMTIDGQSPTLEDFSLVTLLSKGEPLEFTGGNSTGPNYYGVKIGKSEDGVRERQGLVGPPGQTTGTLKPDIIERKDLLSATYNFSEDYVTFGLFETDIGTGIFTGIRDNRIRSIEGFIPGEKSAFAWRNFVSGEKTEEFLAQLEE